MSMTPERVVSAVKLCNISCAHMCFTEGSAPPLPWAVYYLDTSSNVHADNSTWDYKANWIVELYEQYKNPELEMALAQALEAEFHSPPSMDETWIEDENCLLTTYRFTEI